MLRLTASRMLRLMFICVPLLFTTAMCPSGSSLHLLALATAFGLGGPCTWKHLPWYIQLGGDRDAQALARSASKLCLEYYMKLNSSLRTCMHEQPVRTGHKAQQQQGLAQQHGLPDTRAQLKQTVMLCEHSTSRPDACDHVVNMRY